MPFTRAAAPAVVNKNKKSVFTSPSDFIKVQGAAAIAMDAVSFGVGNTKAALAAAKSAGMSAISSANAIVTAVVGSATVTTSLGHEGGTDGFLLAVNSDTTLKWGAHIGGVGTDTIQGCVVDSLGRITVVGTSVNSPLISVFDSTNLSSIKNISNPNTGRYITFISQYTGSGSLLWTAYLGGNHDNQSIGIAVDASNNLYIGVNTGSTSNATVAYNADGSTFGSITPVNATGLVCKILSTGAFSWIDQIYGSVDNTNLYDIAVDSAGSIVVAGQRSGSTTGTSITQSDTTTYSYTSITSRTTYNFIAKFTSAGMVSRFLQIGGIAAQGDMSLVRMSVDSANNILMTGLVSNGISITDSASATKTITSGTWSNASTSSGFWLAKMASDLSWGANGFLTYGACNYTNATPNIGGVCADSSNNVYVCVYGSYNNGLFIDSSDFPTSGIKLSYYTYNNWADTYLYKLKPDGTSDASTAPTANAWAIQIAGFTQFPINRIKSDSADNIYLSGSRYFQYYSQTGDQLNIQVYNKANSGFLVNKFFNQRYNTTCAATVKIGAGGTSAQVYVFDSRSSTSDTIADTCIDSSGNVYGVGGQGARMIPAITINP